jgi:flagellar assembly factor FliW
MLESNIARSSQPLRAPGEPSAAAERKAAVVIETRFGPLEFGPANSIFMPVGPLGFGACHHFGLAELPKPASDRFKLLQSLDNHDLGFIVTQLEPDDARISRDDLEDAAMSVGIPMEAALFLLIVTIRANDESTSITANLRAPVVLDKNRLVARQVVMANNALPIQMPI